MSAHKDFQSAMIKQQLFVGQRLVCSLIKKQK
nr:MAG TPA: hypothetical protein [Caudoviricetes sp.]